MPRLQLYLSDEEYEYVKAKDKGWVRDLVKEAMDSVVVERTPGGITIKPNPKRVVSPKKMENHKNNAPKKKEITEKVQSTGGDGLHNCKYCGYLLPFYKGTCKACGKKQ